MPEIFVSRLGAWGHGGYHSLMSTSTTDPRFVSVQLQFRVPFWYKQQLMKEAHKKGTNVPALVRQALEASIVPDPPK